MEGWWSGSGSASPPPAPRAPPHPCPRCRGRLPPLQLHPAAAVSHPCLAHAPSHVYHDGWSVGGGAGGCGEDEESTGGALRERELRSLHRTVPALRRRELDTRAIKHHFYPEGGWGWIVCGAAFLAHLLSTGLQLAYGALHVYAIRHFGERSADHVVWAGALCVGVSRVASAVAAGGGGGAGARRRSPRLAALLGGLLLPLACLFTSFATQLHQAILSYGVVLGVGCGLVRESAGLVLGAYFRRRRQFVELVAHAGGGVGIALFSVCYKEAVGKLGWRLGLQAVTGALVLGFFLSAVYRSASLYHPQRRAIQHLKNQRRKVKEKKSHASARPPLLDVSPLRSRPARVLLLAAAVGALGLYTPVFYLALQGYREGLEDSALVLLQTFLGFAAVLGCAGFGLVLVRPSAQCLISKQYLCQTALLGIGVSMLALMSVQGYHGYVLFAWMYGLCLGGFLYSIKMLTMERVRARHFARVWGYVQGAEAIPVIVGVPMTGYINQYAARAGYYFSFAATVAAAFLLFFVGFSKREPGDSVHSAAPPPPAAAPDDCGCPGASPPRYEPPPPPAWCSCATVAGAGYCAWSSPAPPAPLPCRARLPKSLSSATPLDRAGCCSAPPYYTECACGCRWPRRSPPAPLRPSKSVPEGLARGDCGTWSRGGSCRGVPACRPRREHQLVEQITTSV